MDEETTPKVAAREVASKARLFDIRRLIGGLFVVYGVVVAVAGMLDSKAEIDKAQGIRINLWTGLAMLALGLVFLLWMWLRPAEPPTPREDAEQTLVSPPERS